MNPWKMEVRGSTFEPSMKTLIPPYSLAYKKRVYSPARVRYPMKRVDFDPDGERNPQNRGMSKYVRISWDEALDVITSEMNRIKEKYGPTALLYQCDQHGENKVVQACHGAGRKLLRAVGRLHPADPPPRQLGRLVVGHQARLGLRAGRPGQAEQPALRHRQERRAAPLLGLRPGDHALGLAGPAPQPPELLVDRAGHQADLRLPRTSTTPPPCTPTSGSRCCPTPTPPSTWPSPTSGSRTAPTTRSTSRPTPSASTSSRPTSWATRTACPRRRSGRRPSAASRPASSRPWPRSGPASAPPWSSATAAPASAAPTPPSRPACRASAWPCRAWASRASTRPR